MKTRTLGRSGPEVSAIGLGCMGMSAFYGEPSSERDAINEALKEASKEHQIDIKVLRKIAKTYHKQNFNDEVANNETFVEVYEQLTKQG